MGEADHPENPTGVRFCLLPVLVPSAQAYSRGLKGMGIMKKAPFSPRRSPNLLFGLFLGLSRRLEKTLD